MKKETKGIYALSNEGWSVDPGQVKRLFCLLYNYRRRLPSLLKVKVTQRNSETKIRMINLTTRMINAKEITLNSSRTVNYKRKDTLKVNLKKLMNLDI